MNVSSCCKVHLVILIWFAALERKGRTEKLACSVFCQTVTSCLQVNASIVMLIKTQYIISLPFFLFCFFVTVFVSPQVGRWHKAKHLSVLLVKAQRESQQDSQQFHYKCRKMHITNKTILAETYRIFQQNMLNSKFCFGPQNWRKNKEVIIIFACHFVSVLLTSRMLFRWMLLQGLWSNWWKLAFLWFNKIP